MDTIRALLSILEPRHVHAIRLVASTMPAAYGDLAEWLEHAVAWEENRRLGIASVLWAPAPLMQTLGRAEAAQIVRRMRGPFVDLPQVRLFLAAVGDQLERHEAAL